jgi:hypothetical protein
MEERSSLAGSHGVMINVGSSTLRRPSVLCLQIYEYRIVKVKGKKGPLRG